MCLVGVQGESECYECQPKPAAKTYPGCSIRNTPSEPIHCIVWAKHLFKSVNLNSPSLVPMQTQPPLGMGSGNETTIPLVPDSCMYMYMYLLYHIFILHVCIHVLSCICTVYMYIYFCKCMSSILYYNYTMYLQ